MAPERFTMKSITIYREDMNNELHGNLFDSLLDDLGIESHTIVDGRPIDRGLEEVTIYVSGSTIEE